MFANDKSIDTLEALFREAKKYLALQGQYMKLDLVEKLTILLSTLILICVLIVLGMMALFYFSFMLVYAINTIVNNIVASYAIIGVCIIALGSMIYIFRQSLIFQPMVRFLSRLFLEDNKQDNV
ncbi:MAG: phage holin family protein [Phocaeicola sp.]|nr:phage holin family protein [Phocaeicola sp.]